MSIPNDRLRLARSSSSSVSDFLPKLRNFKRNSSPADAIDVIAIDSIYTPIKNVKYTVENFRVDQKTDYEKLIIEITTNGSIRE